MIPSTHPAATTGFHTGGRKAFDECSRNTGVAGVEEGRMWSACRTLRRRLATRCQPVSLAGHWRVFMARRRWLRRIRNRFTRPQALFLGTPAIFRIRSCSRGLCR